MKKVVMMILLFAVIAIAITGALIHKKNNEILSNCGDNEKINNSNEEKTLDLYGTYNENDIVIEERYVKANLLEQEIKIPTIKGLRDKSVEEKINKDIKNRIIEKLDNVDNTLNIEANYDVHGNFANVLSISYRIYHKGNYHIISELAFNYELLNGNRLNFEDLFKTNTDIYSIVRRAYYRALAKYEQEPYVIVNDEYYNLYDIHFDKEKNIWIGTYEEYDEDTNEFYKKEIEYIPTIAEEEINQKITEFMKEEDKIYYFTPARINLGTYNESMEFKDIADEVVIYDKYITKESLYESSDIGLKNIWTCMDPLDYSYMNYGFAEDNFYYDITTPYSRYLNENYYFKESKNKLMEQIIANAKEKVEEYKKVANENPNNFYILMIQPTVNETYTQEDTNYLLFDNTVECYAYSSISHKKEIIDMLLEKYRYYNLGFYSTILECCHEYGIWESELFNEVNLNTENKVYDARNLKEIKSIAEIFKEDIDYLAIIEDMLKDKIRSSNYVSEENLEKYVKNASYELELNGISCKVPESRSNPYYIWTYDIDPSVLKIYDIDLYLIPDSSTRKIEKKEIEDLSLDELNKAYNEIFARHGHEFVNKELKEYFNELSWYHAESNKTVSLEELNEIERDNLSIIKSVIEDKKKN